MAIDKKKHSDKPRPVPAIWAGDHGPGIGAGIHPESGRVTPSAVLHPFKSVHRCGDSQGGLFIDSNSSHPLHFAFRNE
jgi:hypothetical protein